MSTGRPVCQRSSVGNPSRRARPLTAMIIPRRRVSVRVSGLALIVGAGATAGQLVAVAVFLAGMWESPDAAPRPADFAESVTFVRPTPTVRSSQIPDLRVGHRDLPLVRHPSPTVREARGTGVSDTVGSASIRTPTAGLSVAPDPRLIVPRPSSGGSIGPVYGRNPFAPVAPPSQAGIDSAVRALNGAMPALIRAHVMTQADGDSVMKVANLAMRLAGRPLLVPADPHLVASFSIDAPTLSRRQSRSGRRHESVSFAENRRRLERLQARVRARVDSVRVADSLAARWMSP
jgi:hypothetical protein